MTTIRIITNAASEGATALSDALRELGYSVTRCRDVVGKVFPKPGVLTLKWGAFQRRSQVPAGTPVLNDNAGSTVLNKLACFQALSAAGLPTPEFTNSNQVADNWVADGHRVYERHSLSGSGGEGIVVVEQGRGGCARAPLYTKGLKGKRREYRIHVFQKDGVKRIFVQQKVRRQGYQENPNYSNEVRNLENGWVFAHNDITPPRTVTVGAAIAAVRSLDLNWGAVDMIEMDAVTGGSYILEINSAPGLQGATVGFYASAVHAVINRVTDGAAQ